MCRSGKKGRGKKFCARPWNCETQTSEWQIKQITLFTSVAFRIARRQERHVFTALLVFVLRSLACCRFQVISGPGVRLCHSVVSALPSPVPGTASYDTLHPL